MQIYHLLFFLAGMCVARRAVNSLEMKKSSVLTSFACSALQEACAKLRMGRISLL